MAKTVVHIFHDDPDALTIGSRLPQRIREVSEEQGVEVEVFCFGAAQRRLTASETEADQTFNRQVDELIALGVPVGACVNAARADGAEEQLLARGLTLRVARDEFLRFTLEGATVVSF
jgi:intracellular sulfur oxidation DsrE/DsrF family protein